MMMIGKDPKIFSGYLYSSLVIGVFSLLAILLEKFLLPKTGVLLLLQLALVIISITNSRLTTTLSSLACALIFNYFFTAPLYTLHMTDAEDITNLVVFLIIALVTSEFSIRYRKQNEALRHAELRSNILLSISHDLRTPLSSIIGAISTLKEYQNLIDDEAKEKLIDSSLQESHRLHHYIENLLQATRLHHGQVNLSPQRQSIWPVIESVRHRLGSDRISIEKATTLPEVCVQQSLMEQALFNIAENALRFSPKDQKIVICCTTDQDNLTIRVSDQGPGIPEDQQAQVFDLFFSTRKGDIGNGGSGIGLTVAKGIVEAHRGNLSVEPTKQGCTLLIHLPKAPADDIK